MRHHLVKFPEQAKAFSTWQEAASSFATLDIAPNDDEEIESANVRYVPREGGWLASITLQHGRFVRFVTRSS